MNLSRTAWISLGSVFLLAGAAPAQVTIEPPGGGGTGAGSVLITPPTASPAPPTQRAATAPATMQSAESILQQLLNNKNNPGTATAPGAGGGAGAESLLTPVGPVPGPDGLLLEGQQIQFRSGHLKRDDADGAAAGAMIFVFDEKEPPVYQPMGVVPSRRLATMENAAGFAENAAGSDMNFRITAEVTQYRGRNYLYIKPSGIPDPPAAKPVAAAAPGPLVTPVAPQVPVAAPIPERNVITKRVGRLVRDAKTGMELIAFDADGKLLGDPPMGVIPCKYLEVMEAATDNGNKPLKFTLSGEVTTYRGRNYLYLKSVTIVTDLNKGIGTGINPGVRTGG